MKKKNETVAFRKATVALTWRSRFFFFDRLVSKRDRLVLLLQPSRFETQPSRFEARLAFRNATVAFRSFSKCGCRVSKCDCRVSKRDCRVNVVIAFLLRPSRFETRPSRFETRLSRFEMRLSRFEMRLSLFKTRRSKKKRDHHVNATVAVEPREQDTLADALPLKTAQEFHALEVLLQEKAKQQTLVCMNQHKYQRTVLFRYYRTTIC